MKVSLKKTFLSSLALILSVILCSCVPESSLVDSTAATKGDVPVAPLPNYSNEQLSLRFLSSYIRGSQSEAAQFATPAALAKLPWKRASPTYIPHFDDRKIFWFDGGLAHVKFGEVNGRNMITDFDVHHRR